MNKYSFLFFLFLSSTLIGQQGVQLSQYMIDKYRINPAYAGLDYSLSASAGLRGQYNSLTGNPNTQWINVHLPYYLWNGAIGMQISNDRVGLFRESDIQLSYNYIMDLPSGLYSAGLQLGGVFSSLAGDDIITPGGNYEGGIINHNDPTLGTRVASTFSPDISLGFYARTQFFEGGLTINNFFPNNINLEQTTIKQLPEIILFAQSRFRITDSWLLVPSVLLKTDNRELQSDLNLVAYYNGNIFGGLGLRGYGARSLDAAVFIIGLQLNKHYRLSYSLDLGTSDLRNAHEGSHEIILNYNLHKLIGVGRDPKIIYNPRHL